jgi:hypothetical protein
VEELESFLEVLEEEIPGDLVRAAAVELTPEAVELLGPLVALVGPEDRVSSLSDTKHLFSRLVLK